MLNISLISLPFFKISLTQSSLFKFRKFDRKESCMQEYLYKHFQTEGHKSFPNEASVTFTDKTDEEDPKKENDIGCEH